MDKAATAVVTQRERGEGEGREGEGRRMVRDGGDPHRTVVAWVVFLLHLLI